MRALKALFVILSVTLSTVFVSVAQASPLREGGATSGGGDELGIEVRRAIRMVADMIREDKGQLYSEEVKRNILKMASNAEIIVVDHALPARSGKLEQMGLAYSQYDGKDKVVIQIQRQRWEALENPSVRDSVIHHEFAVLAGYEKTGRYDYSDRFAVLRTKFWEKVQSQQLLCTVGVFEKNVVRDFDGQKRKFHGAAGIYLWDNVDIRGGIKVLADLEKREEGEYAKSLLMRYVASGNGYLRAVFTEADSLINENTNFILYEKVTRESDQKILFTPYDVAEGVGEARIIPWADYIVQVGCSKL